MDMPLPILGTLGATVATLAARMRLVVSRQFYAPMSRAVALAVVVGMSRSRHLACPLTLADEPSSVVLRVQAVARGLSALTSLTLDMMAHRADTDTTTSHFLGTPAEARRSLQCLRVLEVWSKLPDCFHDCAPEEFYKEPVGAFNAQVSRLDELKLEQCLLLAVAPLLPCPGRILSHDVGIDTLNSLNKLVESEASGSEDEEVRKRHREA